MVLSQDSDGDGVTDEDESAAGTDPDDPASHPAVLPVLDLIAHGQRPRFERQTSHVLVLPTEVDRASITPARAWTR